jgi:hypothetical protein
MTVLARGGTYFLDEPVVLNPEDSGTKAQPVTYAAYPGERAIVSGGRRIAGWSKEDNRQWTAPGFVPIDVSTVGPRPGRTGRDAGGREEIV